MPIKVYDTTVTQIFELTLLKNQTFQHPGFGFPNSSVVSITGHSFVLLINNDVITLRIVPKQDKCITNPFSAP